MSGLSQQWLDRATEDLAVARLVFNAKHFGHVCFLSQQRIEKSLKGYLLARNNRYPRTHKLIDLISLCQRVEESFKQFLPECTIIDQYYIPTRYPDGLPGGGSSDNLPQENEAEEALAAAEHILNFVINQLA